MSSFNNNVPPSREDFAYDSIKEAILSGELLPNQKISLSDLANKLGISIIPVNSAIGRLVAEGLVRQDPHHSPYVVEFSSSTVNEILTIRYHLEELALREAIPYIHENELIEIRKKIDEMIQARDNNAPHLYGQINRAFHMKIYSFGPYKMLNDIIEDLWNKSELNRARSVFVLVPNMMNYSLKDHIDLATLIEQGKTQEAVELLKKHKNFSRVKLLEEMEKIGI